MFLNLIIFKYKNKKIEIYFKLFYLNLIIIIKGNLIEKPNELRNF